MVDIHWVCSLNCGWSLVSKWKPSGGDKHGKDKCPGKIITKKRAKKEVWRKQRHEKMLARHKKNKVLRHIEQDVADVTRFGKSVREFLKEE